MSPPRRVPRPVGPAGPRDPRAAHPRDVSGAAFPHMTAREVGDVPVVALRVTYVGELGWELYCAMEFGLRLWDTSGRRASRVSSPAAIRRSTPPARKGLSLLGRRHHARLQPLEAGLGFAVKLDKGDFIGREALVGAEGRRRALLSRVRRPPRGCTRLGARQDRRGALGRVTCGGYGYTVERSIAYGYLPAGSRRGRAAASRSRSSANGCRRGRSRAVVRPGRGSHPFVDAQSS